LKIHVKKEESEVIIDPEDREIISATNKQLESLKNDEIELIESIIELNLSQCDMTHPDPNILKSIGTGLGFILNPHYAVVLLNLISNPDHIKITADKLISESLIGENTYNSILNLSAKYGNKLHTILLNIERPDDWLRITSHVLITDDLKLHSKLWRMDGEVFQFNVPINDSIVLAEHFIRKTLEAIRLIDKERILEFNEDQIDKLEKQINEFKELYESVKSDIEEIEHTK
jgi:hypothetical protein